MAQLDTFVESARERASKKNMAVEVYLARQIELSALALGQVCGNGSSRESTAVAFDVRELTRSAAASVALSPLSQIDVQPDNEEDEEEVEIILQMSKRKYRELREKGELYQVERGIWRFIPEEHRDK
jgi:hypothetical protein